MALVIQSWHAADTPDQDGNYIVITGREAGLLAFLLNLVGIDASTKLRINAHNVYLEQGSLEGFQERVIPLSRLSSAFFGYKKPLKEAIILGIILLGFFGLGLIVGPLYYYLNKTTSVGVVEVSGVISGIDFKRSVIEGKNINENEGRRVIGIIRNLIELHTTKV